MPKRKTAMVQPPPAKTEDPPFFADPVLEARLIKTLQSLKNTNAYTVLEYHYSWASVHFEGDLKPRVIVYK